MEKIMKSSGIAGVYLSVIIFVLAMTLGLVVVDSYAQENGSNGDTASEEIPPFPEDPADIPDWIEQVALLVGTGLVAKLLTDLLKLLPWIPDNENTRKQMLRLASALISFVVAFLIQLAGGNLFGALNLFKELDLGGLFAVILSMQWGVHRTDKALRSVSARLLGRA